MKITFEEDGSFLGLETLKDDRVRLVLCAKRDFNKTTMSAIDLEEPELLEILSFLLKWQEKKVQNSA